MGLFKDINDSISEFLCEKKEKLENIDRKDARIEKHNVEKLEKHNVEKLEKHNVEKLEKHNVEKLEKHNVEKLEKETRKKYWLNVKDEILARYQLPIADDAKNVAKDLFGRDVDTVSAFFITDERVVRQIYIDGGDKAIEEYAKNLIKYAFIGGPITATLLTRLKLLEDAKREEKVIDTEIDIDSFVPNARIQYTVDRICLDGQIIPARRKFSIRCEMTATITEGFRIGPLVSYNELYISAQEEIEQITDEDLKIGTERKENIDSLEGQRYGKMYQIEVCSHGTDRKLYCNHCHGDIIVSPSRKKVIGICLDNSGSMNGDRLSNAKRAVIKVLEMVPVNSNIDVVLIIFDGDLRMNHEDIIPFGKRYTESTRDMAIKKVNGIITGGGTPLYDTVNYFLDEIWSGIEVSGRRHNLLDESRIFFPYTYLIIVSDGEENQSSLENIIYKGRTGSDAFFAKLINYRNAGLVTEVIPFAYGNGEKSNRLIRELQNISGKKLIKEVYCENIIESLVDNVNSILYGEDNLKMMGLSINGKSRN